VRRITPILVCGFLVCAAAACQTAASPTARPDATASKVPLASSTAPPQPTADLAGLPLYWFAPLPPMPTGPGRMFTGSNDFMDLFSPEAEWQATSAGLHVFKLYGEWVAYHASDAQLARAVAEIRRRGLALAIEAGPLDATAECGQGVESFAGVEEGRHLAQRILDAGGTLDFIALDEPYFFAHVYDGPNACHWPVEKIAADVAAYIGVMRGYFPDVRVGDTEPLAGAAGAAAYQDWLDSYREVNGSDPAFLHMDIDWSRPGWPEEVLAIDSFGERFGVPIGIIYNGNPQDPDDEAWVSIAGERVKRYELDAGGTPEHVLFQSWNDKPDRALPESEPTTFTGFVLTYLTDRAALGFATTGENANLALHKPTDVSSVWEGYAGFGAVDGDPGTLWNAGGGPPQWIEIDLGEPIDVTEIRLLTSQSPAGQTVHRVYGKGPATDGVFALLAELNGPTDDSQSLVVAASPTWIGIQVLRVETVVSPSWVAWREIEVHRAP
jgi:hypothetical protein